MNASQRGMSTIGSLNPAIEPLKVYHSPESAWQDVANAFSEVGNAMRRAINEQGKPAADAANKERQPSR
jgi:hypothetical protein